ncbi:small ribosomal subunit protein mS23 [Eurosta solidaginis]|uniref:small ribosomal subunit protein mS23 n=1 Tax=Eurosta solidaginis TaxID=178769 RepID=UPI003530EBAF
MAQSRLEKIGTIFSRVEGLVKANAMKMEDRPIWYDLYVAFPPKLEPRYDRKAPDIQIKKIFYAEDITRAKFHKQFKQYETINLADIKRKTQTQHFLEIYHDLKAQNPLDEEKLYETAVEMLATNRSEQPNIHNPIEDNHDNLKTSILADFEGSLENRKEHDRIKKVNIQKLFSE